MERYTRYYQGTEYRDLNNRKQIGLSGEKHSPHTIRGVARHLITPHTEVFENPDHGSPSEFVHLAIAILQHN